MCTRPLHIHKEEVVCDEPCRKQFQIGRNETVVKERTSRGRHLEWSGEIFNLHNNNNNKKKKKKKKK
jgi:hypothetical protein